MTAPGEIVVAEVYCLACGQALRLRPAAGGCPGCGKPVRDALAGAIMAGGHRHVRRIGRALRLAGGLNVGLGLGCLLNPATMWVTGWYVPLGVLFLLSVAAYAWLQVLAGGRVALPRPGEQARWPRSAILLSGACFAGAATAALAGMLAYALGAGSDGLYRALGMACRAGLPGLAVFVWFIGGQYQCICQIAGMRRLGETLRRREYINTLGAVMLAAGGLLAPGWNGRLEWSAIYAAKPAAMLMAGGLALTIGGMVITSMLQFLMAQRLSGLSDTLGDRTVLTGPQPE